MPTMAYEFDMDEADMFCSEDGAAHAKQNYSDDEDAGHKSGGTGRHEQEAGMNTVGFPASRADTAGLTCIAIMVCQTKDSLGPGNFGMAAHFAFRSLHQFSHKPFASTVQLLLLGIVAKARRALHWA